MTVKNASEFVSLSRRPYCQAGLVVVVEAHSVGDSLILAALVVVWEGLGWVWVVVVVVVVKV